MTVAIGQLLDEEGHAAQVTQHVTRSTSPGRSFDVESRWSFRATPARNVRPRQGVTIPVNIGHNKAAEVGQVVHLELTGRHLWAVCELDHDLGDDGTWKFSVETMSTYKAGSLVGEDVEVTGLGLVARSAQTNLRPVRFLPGTVTDAARRVVHQDGLVGQLVRNAADVLASRRQHRPITVANLLTPEQEDQRQYALVVEHYYRQNPAERPSEHPDGLRYSQHIGRVLSVR